MALSYPVSIPAVGGIRSVRIGMHDAVGAGASPYTFAQETYEHPGKRWTIEVQLAPLIREEAEEWIAFLASLRGRYGTFLLGDPVGATPRGVGGGSPVVNGASQVGQTLSVRAAPGLTAGWLLKGDWIQLGSGASARLHKCLTDVTPDSGGVATLELWPGPRVGAAPADGDAVTISSAKGVWRLAANPRGYDITEAAFFGIQFSAVEAL